MVSHEHKCIFFHPPRNGGKSVEAALFWKKIPTKRKRRADHRVPQQVLEEIGKEKFNEYFKFGFARNTWDRLTSCYRYDTQRRPEEFRGIGFKRWVKTRTIVNEESIYSTSGLNKRRLSGMQLDSFSLGGKPCLDFFGKFDNYQEDWRRVCEILNVDIELPHLNRTGKRGRGGRVREYTDYYDEYLKNAVAEKYKKEIDFFNFKFGD